LNEDRFREIHFARDGLHLIVRKAVAVSEDRDGIALESRGGENVESVKTVFHWILSRGRSGFGKSDSLKLDDGPFVGDVSGIACGLRFNQNDVHFFVRHGAVLQAARDNYELTFANDSFPIAELHAQRSFDDQEQLVFVVVMMPDKFAF
jgi:hypothetical protein